jgi:deazaflavin-dependent oxidoreductase (nitroreductase family)
MRLQQYVRTFNKHVTNRILGRVARSKHGLFAFVRHVGRRSGKTYETPVIVFPLADGFVLALTYGKEVDWYRNVTAAGRCVIIWHQREYAISRIEPMTLEGAKPLLRQPFRTLLGVFGTQHFVRMYNAA